jgi:NADH-quinone oxidoreductase subunit C
LDARGEALMAALPGPIAACEPEVTSSLDEVVVTVQTGRLLAACQTLRQDPSLGFDYLRCLSVVDYEESLQVVYHLWSREHRHKLTLKTDVPNDAPVAPTVTAVWPGADWFEREAHDLFGVEFEGHPDLKPLLLWEGFEGYPGRKSYPFNEYTEW